MLKLSVIIPTLNEAENIASLLEYLFHLDPELELIVVDGASIDDTAGLAAKYARVILSEKGRGVQMNAGAQLASGDVLWFIHADCRPHRESVDAIRKALANPKIVGGAFEYNLDHPGPIFRVAETLSNLKNRLLTLFFGDMGIFVRRNIFNIIHGYREIYIMEDMDFVKD